MCPFCVFCFKGDFGAFTAETNGQSKTPVNQLLVSSYGAVMKITFSSQEISLEGEKKVVALNTAFCYGMQGREGEKSFKGEGTT